MSMFNLWISQIEKLAWGKFALLDIIYDIKKIL